MGFLLPAIQTLVKLQAEKNAGQGAFNPGFSVLIISPTRELANQIAKEAQNFLSFHKGLQVCTMVGGTNIKKD